MNICDEMPDLPPEELNKGCGRVTPITDRNLGQVHLPAGTVCQVIFRDQKYSFTSIDKEQGIFQGEDKQLYRLKNTPRGMEINVVLVANDN